MKEQLTLEILCPYLPYGIIVCNEINLAEFGLCKNTKEKLIGIAFENVITDMDEFGIKYCKPIFRNLKTDLTREIEHDGLKFIPLEWLRDNNEFDPIDDFIEHLWDFSDKIQQASFDCCPIWVANHLQKWHFWIYDQSFFEKGIIIEKKD